MVSVRRLSAIMFTDMVGYTSSTQTDEARTLELLQQQQELVRPLISAHHGREIKSTGDGFLVEFDSALRATQCAVDIQRRIYERNAQTGLVPIQIRIGIHLGDVEQRGTDILGDAVNIAARIEPIAEPGGVCVSGAVREQVWNKIPDKLEKLPPQALKGLQISMDIYRVVLPSTVRDTASVGSEPTGIAILPFTNISPDPKDEYFADGLTEELIAVLSQLRELRVIARTSVTPYKSTSKGVAQIGAELGVSSILEGSVRRAGNQLRITAQLIDVASQGHLWSNSYNRELSDVFAVQAELAKQVADALKVELRPIESARLGARAPVRPDSYLTYLKGRALLHNWTDTARRGAKEQFELAISLDPKNAAAYAGLAAVTSIIGWWSLGLSRAAWSETARGLVDRALELDPGLAEARVSRAFLLMCDYNYQASEVEFRNALSLNPSDALAHRWYSILLTEQSRDEEALVELRLAEGIDPLSPLTLYMTARHLLYLERFEDALARIQKLGAVLPGSHGYHGLLGTYYRLRGDVDGCLNEWRQAAESETDPRDAALDRAWLHMLSGEKDQARALLQSEETLPDYPPTYSRMAAMYAELGDLDSCFRWLEKAADTHDFARNSIHWLRQDPKSAHVRADPRFLLLLKKRNLA